MRNSTLQTEALLEHASWMRHLALSLVGDAERAEDLTQETWVKALEHPPATDAPLRGWLATVMQNLFRQEHRGRVRRSDRETVVVARDDANDDSGPELLARVKLQRELVELVLTLDEPYRKVVLLRYFEELTPKRIAEQEGTPLSTVKTQLARGLERLRERLDHQHGGDGRSWVVALLPVLEQPAGLVPSAGLTLVPIGALLMNLKVVLAVAVLAILGTGYMISLPEAEVVQAEQSQRAELETAALPQRLQSTSEQAALPTGVSSSRQAVAAPTSAPKTAEVIPPPVPAVKLVHGKVVNLRGQPVEGLAIVTRSSFSAEALSSTKEPVLATSAADGSFSAPRTGVAALFVRDAQFTTVLAGVPASSDATKQAIVVVAPRIELAGRVVDEYGNVVAGARIDLSAPEGLRGELGFVFDFSQDLKFTAESDSDGHFEIPNAPGFIDGLLRATAEGYSPLEQPAPETSGGNYQLVLRRPELTGDLLTGIVVDELGTPVPGAQVSMGIDSTRTDAAGGFTFNLSDPESFNARLAPYIGEFTADELIAIKPGFLPGRMSARGTDDSGRPIWPDLVMLRLGAEPLTIRGRVVDDSGTALTDMQVWVADPTFFGGIDTGGRFPDLQQVENLIMDRPGGWAFVETAADGSFELTGLLERNYTVEAMDPGSLIRARQLEVPAGTPDLELVISHVDSWEVVRGRVVDGRGNPLANASVQVWCDAFRTRIKGNIASTQHSAGSVTTTDEEGRFELQVVPKEEAYFRVDHSDALPIELGRSEQALRRIVGEDYDDFTLVVPLRCHFQVKLRSPAEADAFELLDADDNLLEISEFQGGGRRENTRFAILDGQTNVLAAGDTAATMVLYLNGLEVRRSPVSLAPGEQSILTP